MRRRIIVSGFAALIFAFTACSVGSTPNTNPDNPDVSTTSSPAATTHPTTAGCPNCASSTDAPSKEPKPKPRNLKFKLKVAERCTTTSGLVRGLGTGFTPLGDYTTYVTYPNGAPVPEDLYESRKQAGKDGTTTDWKWRCGPDDMPGDWHFTVVDETSQSEVSFAITVHKS